MDEFINGRMNIQADTYTDTHTDINTVRINIYCRQDRK